MRSLISVFTVLCDTLMVLGTAMKLEKFYMCCEPKEMPGRGVGSSDVVYFEDERPGRSEEWTSGGRGGTEEHHMKEKEETGVEDLDHEGVKESNPKETEMKLFLTEISNKKKMRTILDQELQRIA